ncbi:hypothetical protein N9W34_06630 [Rickettsiales bacterium]|nr:hypothetical protein [Rickettsiales bacterium]
MKILCVILKIVMITTLMGMTSSCGFTNRPFAEASDDSRFLRQLLPRAMRKEIYGHTPTERHSHVPDDRLQERTMEVGPENMSGERMITAYDGNEDSYGKGFQDGCDTFTGIVGAGLERTISPKYRPEQMVEDPWYLRGFQDGSSFCTFRMDWEMH